MLINKNTKESNILLKQIKLKKKTNNSIQIILLNHIFWDMLYCIKIWRLIHGYSSKGQRSHSNNKSNKKKKK